MTVDLEAETTRDDIAEALSHLSHYAGRLPHHPDCNRWVMAHAQIDALLDDWQAKA